MAFEWDIFRNNEETSNPLFYELGISSLEPSDINSGGLLIDPALGNPNLTNTGPLIWDLPEEEQEGSSNQEHGLEIKALHSPSSEQALNDLRSEFRKLIDEQEIRWGNKFQALEQKVEQKVIPEIEVLSQKLDKIKVEYVFLILQYMNIANNNRSDLKAS
jgi:hypothetical protein